MKYLWIFLVFSATALGQNAYGPDYLNLHCTTPDTNANASFGDLPRPGLAPSSATNGSMVIYCDASSGILKTSVNGGAYNAAGGALNGAVNAASSGVKADGHIVTNPSFTNTSNIVTCSLCNFTGTDVQGRPNAVVGQVVFGTTATSDVSALTSTLTSPECVIQSIDSATQIHMGTFGSIGTACNATVTTVTTGFIVWGDLDSANASQTPSTTNDPLLNAWTTSANNCQALALPSGVMLVERGEFNTNSTGTCSTAPSTTFIRGGYGVYGQGPANTIIVPTPNFVSADCVNGCFFSATGNMQIQDLQINGVGNASCGAGFNGKNLIEIAGPATFNGTNFALRHVIFQGWCAAQTGVNGMQIGSGASTIAGGLISDSIFETLGFTGVNTNYGNGASTVMVQVSNSQFTACGNGGCLTVNGGNWSSSHTFYGFTNATTGNQNAVNLNSGSISSFIGDFVGYPTGNNIAEIGCTGCTLKLTNTIVNNTAGGSSAALAFGVGTNVIIALGSTISDSGSSFACNGAGVVCNWYDLGGNTVTGAIGTTGGGVFNQWQSSSITGTSCSGVNFALTSGWGTSSVAGASGDSHRCHVTVTGAAGAAGPVLTWTYPKAYLAAPFSCNLTGGGTDGSLTTVRLTTLSATTAAFTFNGTPTAVTYIFDIGCGP